jgi:hypothetical protein
MNKEGIYIKGNIGESEPEVFKDVNLSNLETPIRFSFKFCSVGGKYCTTKLEKEEFKKLYDRLGHFEDMTWRQVLNIPHEKGISAESKSSYNHKYLKTVSDKFSSFGHFRVNGTSKAFRVFGGQQNDLFYILVLDREGDLNHK